MYIDVCIVSLLVVSDSMRPHRRQPTRLPCPWDSPGKNTGVGCHFLLHVMTLVGRKFKQEGIYVYICMYGKSP